MPCRGGCVSFLKAVEVSGILMKAGRVRGAYSSIRAVAWPCGSSFRCRGRLPLPLASVAVSCPSDTLPRCGGFLNADECRKVWRGAFPSIPAEVWPSGSTAPIGGRGVALMPCRGVEVSGMPMKAGRVGGASSSIRAEVWPCGSLLDAVAVRLYRSHSWPCRGSDALPKG